MGGSTEHKVEGTSTIEWIVAAAGAMLVSAAVGYMIYFAIAFPTTPPQVLVERLSTVRAGEDFLVRFRVMNRGNSTAAGLMVGGELRNADQKLEESEATIDYLPQHSEREGGLFFTRDPSAYNLQLRVKGYAKP